MSLSAITRRGLGGNKGSESLLEVADACVLCGVLVYRANGGNPTEDKGHGLIGCPFLLIGNLKGVRKEDRSAGVFLIRAFFSVPSHLHVRLLERRGGLGFNRRSERTKSHLAPAYLLHHFTFSSRSHTSSSYRRENTH